MAGFFLADAFLDVVRGSGEEDVADSHQCGAAEAGRIGVVEAFAVLFGRVRDIEFEFQNPGDAVFFVVDVVELEAAGLLQEQLADDEAFGSFVPSFGDFLGARDLVLRSDLLGAWSHWITPAFEPRRYDTRFFVAAVPRGQSVGTLPGEADRATWASIASVLEAVKAGEAAMLPPTWITCRELAQADPATLVDDARAREVRPIEPRLVKVDGEWFLDNPIEEETHG